jgi:hypothetical protein
MTSGFLQLESTIHNAFHYFSFFYKLILRRKNTTNNSSLFNEFVCKLDLFWHGWPHECQKRPNLHTNELNTFFCSTSPLKAPNRLKSLKLA